MKWLCPSNVESILSSSPTVFFRSKYHISLRIVSLKMATELQKQVSSFKKKTVQAQSLQKGLPSIFLSPKEAAAVDTSAVYEAGCKGLRDLIQYDDRFATFESSLFHSSSVNLQRELKTKEENAAIDVEIHSLLNLLTLWATESSSHLVLEYLIRRYRVHEFNMDALLRTFLIAHDSKVFAKIVHLCHLEDTSWVFLAGVKDTGVPPPRSLFVTQALKSPWILDTVCDLTSRILSLLGIKKSSPKSNVSSVEMETGFKSLAFVTAIIVEVANKSVFREEMLRNICLLVIEGLKSKIRPQHSVLQKKLLADWKVSSCVIISQLSVRTQFGDSIIKAFSKAIAVAVDMIQEDEDLEELLDTLVTTASILSQGGQFLVNDNILNSFFPSSGSSSWFYTHIENSSESYQGLLLLVASSLFAQVSHLHNLTGTGNADEELSSQIDASSHIVQFLKRGWVDASDLSNFLSAVLVAIGEKRIDASKRSEIDLILRSISDYQPQVFNTGVKLNLTSNPTNAKAVTKYLSSVFTNFGKTVDASNGDSVFLNLSSAIKELRMHALASFECKTDISTEEEVTANDIGIADALVRCVEDTDYEIASQSWNTSIVNIILKSLGPSRLFQSAQIAWQLWSQEAVLGSKSALSVLHRLLGSLSDAAFGTLLEDAALRQVVEAWGVLVSTSSIALYENSDSKTAGKVVSSATALLVSLLGKYQNTRDKKHKNKQASKSNYAQEVASIIGDDNQHELILVLERAILYVDSDFSLRGFASFLVDIATSMQQSKHLSSLHALLMKSLSPLVLQSLSRGSTTSADICNKTYAGFVQVLLPSMVSLVSGKYTSFDASLRTSLEPLTGEHPMEAVLLQLLASSGVRSEALHSALDNVDRNDVLALLVRFLQSPIDISFPLDEITVRTISLCSVEAVLLSSTDVGTACLPSLLHLLRLAASNTAVLRSLATRSFTVLSSLLQSCKTRTLPLRSDLSIKVDEISIVVEALVQQQEMIQNDGDSLSSIVFDTLVANQKVLETMTEVLLLAASSISTAQDEYASFIVKMLPTSYLEKTWKATVRHLQNASARASGRNEGFLSALLLWITKDLAQLKEDKQTAFIQYICDMIQQAKSLETTLPKLLLTFVIPMLPLKVLPTASFEQLLRCLFDVQSSTTGSKDVVNAILAMEADPALGMMLLQDALNTTGEIDAMLRIRKNSIVDEDAEDVRMQVDGEDEQKDESVRNYESKGVSISAKLRSMVAVAEMVVPMVITQAANLQAHGFVLFRALFALLDKLCQPGCVSVMNLEFYKTMVSELLMQLLCKAEAENIISTLLSATSGNGVVDAGKISAKSSGKGKKKAVDTPASCDATYTLEMMRKDLSNILQSLSSVRSPNIQSSALAVIRYLVTHRSDGLTSLIELLGEFLSQSAAHGTHLLTRGKLLVNLLSIIVPAEDNSSKDAASKSVSLATRDVVFHIMKSLSKMPTNHRTALLKSLAKVEGSKDWMTLLIVQNLLQHTLVKYESKSLETKNVEIDSISLSRAAQRRAQRVLLNSDSEEFFHMAEQFLLEQSSLSIIKSVIKILDAARGLTLFSIGSATTAAAMDTDDIDRLLDHFTLLRSAENASVPKDTSEIDAAKRGHAATIAVLQLEFINEILLSPQFHRQLASDMLANRVTHTDMMEVAECSLQICVECDALRQSRQRSSQRAISLRMENESHLLSAKGLSEIFADMSLNVLGNMQALLDGPSFLTMIQELLDHEVPAIRQRAILFLKDRLQSLLSEKRMSQIEHGLYLDLCNRLRAIIKSNLSKLFEEKTDNTVASTGTLSLPYAQSALLAIDVLVLKLGKTAQWQTVAMDILGEYLSYFDTIYALVGLRSSSGHYQQKALESRKFLGSLLLSCSSLCMALHAAALPLFPSLMEKTMRVFVAEVSQWRDDSVRAMNLESDRRAHVLFLRSLISATGIMFSSLPKFSHPYVASVLPLLLEVSTSFTSSRDIVDLSGLDEDSEGCLVVIGNDLPPRLAIPAICSCLLECTVLGGDAMYRYVTLLQTLVTKSDRSTCVNNMNILLPVVLSLMKSLRNSTPGLQRQSFEEVQGAIGEFVVELCLKLTENELKTFMVRLVDWKAGANTANGSSSSSSASDNTNSNDEDKYYRVVHFYSTIHALLERFQSLFFSSIALLWTDMMTDLENNAKFVKRLMERTKASSEGGKDDASGKKRKRATDIYNQLSDENKLVVGLVFDSVSHVMAITRVLCGITGASFIDEKRYETIYPKILSFVPMWQSFAGDDSYFHFAREQLSTTLCDLCVNINRDLLWKPLNHQVLLFTRNASPLVRIVAVDILRELFEKVGADYLAVLPECLSYISELLEDDNSEVVKHTRQAISVIEELSGESLDSYLQ